MKLYGEPIAVRLNIHGQPNAIRWRLAWLRVQNIIEEWSYAGKWWTTPGILGRHRHYYRLNCIGHNSAAIVLEIYYESAEVTAENRPGTKALPIGDAADQRATCKSAAARRRSNSTTGKWMLSRVVD